MRGETGNASFLIRIGIPLGDVPRAIDGEKDRVWTRGNIGWICVYSSSRRRSPDCDPRTICANREAGLANKPNGRRPFPRTGEWSSAGHSDIFMIGWNIGRCATRVDHFQPPRAFCQAWQSGLRDRSSFFRVSDFRAMVINSSTFQSVEDY